VLKISVGNVAGSVEAVWSGTIPGEEPDDRIWQEGVFEGKERG
jgi:hypothetical protein